jgi:hypothetical protein
MTVPLLIHIGYHKTATTWMQRQLFMPAHGYRQICGHREVFDHIVGPHGLAFDPAPMQALIAERLAAVEAGQTAVISSEILSGHPFYGGWGSDIHAARLHRIAPEARILISIRHQMQILPSVYMQYVLRGGTMPPAAFFAGTQEIEYAGFAPEHFEYDALVGHYQRLFGRQGVHVLTQESLRGDAESVLRRLAEFAGNDRYAGLVPAARKPVSESYPEHAAGLLRRINHVQRSTLNPWPIMALGTTPMGLFKLAGFLMKKPPLQNLLRQRKPVTAYVRQRFAGHFAASNARLAALIAHPVDLSPYEGAAPQARTAGQP